MVPYFPTIPRAASVPTAKQHLKPVRNQLFSSKYKCDVLASYRQRMRRAVRSTSFFIGLKFSAFAFGQNLLVLRLYST